MTDRPTSVLIRGRAVSVGGRLEHGLALVFDHAELHLRYAATMVREPAVWASSKAYASGALSAAAIFAGLFSHEIDYLFADRCGAPPWAIAGEPILLEQLALVLDTPDLSTVHP